MARLGGPAKEQDRSLPDGFLLEMMEVREAIEHAQASGDPREVERWRAWANARRADYTRRVRGLFQRHAAAGRGVEEALRSEIRKELNGWRYVERLIEQLEPAPDAPKSSTGDPGMGPA